VQKKYQVFISSTFRDLVDERQDTLKSVLDMGNIPSGMEIFPAADVEQFDYIKKIIDECDYYVLIVAARYGSMDEEGVSFTEKEYRYAVHQKKTVLAFIHGELGSVAVDKADTDRALQEKLAAFRREVAKSRLVQFWKSRDDLKAKVIISLHKAISEYPALGWMRANAAASEDLLAQVNQLRLENDELRSRMVTPFDGEEQLAPPTSSFSIQYKYQYFDRNAWRGAQDTAAVDWRTLLVLLAPQFTSPRRNIIASLLSTALKEKKFIPTNREEIDIFSTDLGTIQAQLHALGFIGPEVGDTTREGRFQLTQLGQRRYLEWATVKASDESRSSP
jgi:hypothetical protein